MKSVVVGCLVILAGITALGAEPPLAVGTRLPGLQGSDLSGQEVRLPEMARGRVAILMFGFSYGSRTAVEAWGHHVQTTWGGDARVAWYQLPMVGGLGRLAKPFITGGMRKETPPQYHGNSVVVFGGTGAWKERLGVKDGRAAYVVILDRDGVVRWILPGALDDSRLTDLDAQVRALL